MLSATDRARPIRVARTCTMQGSPTLQIRKTQRSVNPSAFSRAQSWAPKCAPCSVAVWPGARVERRTAPADADEDHFANDG